MSIMVVDRFGNERDVTVVDNVQFPIAQIMEIMEPKTSSTVRDEIVPTMEHTMIDKDGRTADIYSLDWYRVMTRVRDGLGVFQVNKDGEEKQIYDPSSYVRSGTSFFGQKQMKIYQGFLFTLNPRIGEVYINTKAMDINHCIITSKDRGLKYPCRCSEFFECIDKSRNVNHAYFVHKWELENAPVSAFDIHRLKDIFVQNEMYVVETGDIDNATDIDDVFIFNNNIPLRRKIIAWYYFIQKHTDGNIYVWECFRDFLKIEFRTYDLPSNEEIKLNIEKFIKF